MNDLSSVAQRLDLGPYCQVDRIDATVDDLSQVLPLEGIVILRTGFGAFDDTPSVNNFLRGAGWHGATTVIGVRYPLLAVTRQRYFDGTNLQPGNCQKTRRLTPVGFTLC